MVKKKKSDDKIESNKKFNLKHLQDQLYYGRVMHRETRD